MSEFIQIHTLTAYPPACLNRDDLGRPKTAHVGNHQRLRISSQCLKRAWRTSDLFRDYREANMGIRTKEIGLYLYEMLKSDGDEHRSLKELVADTGHTPPRLTPETLDEDRVEAVAQIAGVFGKCNASLPKKNDKQYEKKVGSLLILGQPVHFSPEEIDALDGLLERIRTGDVQCLTKKQRESEKEKGAKDLPPPVEPKELDLLRKKTQAVDIAMFGRMLASSPAYNKEAAVQVSHAFTVHAAAVEDDYFSAVDDLNNRDEDSGAAHIGEAGFGAGLFYNYVCVNRSLLEENLPGYESHVARLLQALLQAVTQVSPEGKQNSFGSRALSHYVRVEKGNDQPRSLALAFYNPCRRDDMLAESIDKIEGMAKQLDDAYGQNWCTKTLKVAEDLESCGNTLAELCSFIAETGEGERR